MLLQLIPHWLRVLGGSVAEVAVVVDRSPATGRIARLHANLPNQVDLDHAIEQLCRSDARIRFVELASLDTAVIQKRWFGKDRPVRCHDGSPILAFAAAFDQGQCDYVLRCDSDMLFRESGWLLEAERVLEGTADLYEPPRLVIHPPVLVSSRALVIRRSRFSRALPMRDLHLRGFRRILRPLQGRPAFVGFENQLDRAVARGYMTHHIGADISLGYSIHGALRAYAAQPWFSDVIRVVEIGGDLGLQSKSWDLSPDYWPQFVSESSGR